MTTTTKGPIEGYMQVAAGRDARGRHRHDRRRRASTTSYVNEAIREAIRRRRQERSCSTTSTASATSAPGIKGKDLTIEVHGTPGQDMAMFMDGPTVEVFGNAQDGVGNTMNAGKVIVHG